MPGTWEHRATRQARPPLPSLTPLIQRAETLECSKSGPLDPLWQMHSHFWHCGATRDWLCQAHPGQSQPLRVTDLLPVLANDRMIASSMTALISIPTLIPFRIRALVILGRHGFQLHLLVICLSLQAPASCGKNIKNLQFLPGRGLLPASLLIPKIAATNGSWNKDLHMCLQWALKTAQMMGTWDQRNKTYLVPFVCLQMIEKTDSKECPIQQNFEWHGMSNSWHRLWIPGLIHVNLEKHCAMSAGEGKRASHWAVSWTAGLVLLGASPLLYRNISSAMLPKCVRGLPCLSIADLICAFSTRSNLGRKCFQLLC